MNLTKKNFHLTRRAAALGVTLMVLPAIVLAQQAPDAGRLLQEDRPAPTLPKASPELQIAPPASAAALPGGAKVVLNDVQFTGNSIFSKEQLHAVLHDIVGSSYDFAGLQALAQKISEYYRTSGYPFTRAFLPEQKFADGVLHITVIEGRYGKVSATGHARFSGAAQNFLTPLAPGSVIKSAPLERAVLILDDHPGIKTAPLIRPGEELGTGDLVVDVSHTPAITGELGLDNYGNRYTGEYRARANLQWDSPFMLGDQISLRSIASDEGQWLGSLTYSLPLGTSGLRGAVGYAHTRYELSKEFKALDATGMADIASVGLSYPLLRSARSNLLLSSTYQYKKLNDDTGLVNSHYSKESHVLPLVLQFDHRDGLLGGGITYGSLAYATGKLNLNSALKAIDATSAKTQGRFDKWNLDIARLQATPLKNLTLFGRFSAQWANKNLDSSEDFGLGGPNGVRAYPVGEGFGDQGWLMQLEARYQVGSVAPYVFYDAGHIKVNQTSWVAGDNTRTLSGYGLGVRYNDRSLSVDASLAWRGSGGAPTSDTAKRNPRLWVTTAWRF